MAGWFVDELVHKRKVTHEHSPSLFERPREFYIDFLIDMLIYPFAYVLRIWYDVCYLSELHYGYVCIGVGSLIAHSSMISRYHIHIPYVHKRSHDYCISA